MVPPDLKKLYRESRLLPFVGAGVSMSVRWTEGTEARRGVSWTELVDKATDLLGFSDPELARMRGTDLQILEYFRIKKGAFSPLTNWLYLRMQPSDDDLRKSPIHESLAKLHDKCPVFYTTNYDDFLERALRAYGVPVHVVADEHDIAYAGQGTHVVKFHGDFNHPTRMVLSESDYQRRLKLEGEMDLKLRADVLGRAIVFIGYSFRDPNVSYLFRLVNETFGSLPRSWTGKRAYIVLPNPSDFEEQLFLARSMVVVKAAGSDSTESVAKILEEIAS